MTPYESAQFFDGNKDQDDPRHECEEEAIADMIENREPDDNSPLEIFGFCRKTIPPAEIKAAVLYLADRLNEYFSKEYGDPEGDNDVFPSAESYDAISAAVSGLTPHVWICESSGSRVLTEQEVAKWREDDK